ncbi:MAG: polyphosphate polymerase domain-containing protein [Anaerolineae bacterium]|nr:polyphosphate polymerase domain-containing protein [Anaerolineae bacterium]
MRFEPFDLTELQDAALLDRVDTKYIIGLHQLYAILPNVERDYRVLTIHTARLHAYQTLYFDTRDFTIYRQHHNGVASRYKVRARRYLDSDLAFLEVKHHTNRKRTVKTRLPIPDIETRLRGQSMEFIGEHTPFDPRELEPKLWNHYTRITLVSRHRPERVTIDTNVEFGWRDDCTMLPGLVIVEVKQARLSQDSEFIQHMRRLGIRPMSYSKYTAGVYSLYKPMKLNNFKAQIRQVNKIMQGEFEREFAY